MADPVSAGLRDALSARRAAGLRLCPCTRVYLVLVVLTFGTYAVGAAGGSGRVMALLVLGLALVKGQLVGDWFMGLAAVRGPWRWVIALWLLVTGILITTAFLLAS